MEKLDFKNFDESDLIQTITMEKLFQDYQEYKDKMVLEIEHFEEAWIDVKAMNIPACEGITGIMDDICKMMSKCRHQLWIYKRLLRIRMQIEERGKAKEEEKEENISMDEQEK